MLSEIGEQPAALERMLAANAGKADRLAELATGVTHVVVAARGTSDNAARYAQYVWGARNRLAVGLTAPSLFGPLDAPPDLAGALVAGISQSGRSPDLVAVMTEASRQGRPTVAITNEPDSPLGKGADVVVELAAGPERAVAATKTYTTELAAVALCGLAFSGEPLGPLAGLPETVGAALDLGGDVAEAVGGLVESDRCVVVGRGFHMATAFEWALKLQELAQILAQPFSAADFRHGPMAVVERGFPVLAVATAGPTYDQMTSLVADLTRRGAHIVTVSDLEEAPGDVVIPIPRIEPWLSPIVAAPVVQMFARELTLARGLDPDSPRGLSKVTLTH
ncbi:MAG TPA: SIS domain-containing protein [Acidimicrobiia bacterium]|nr:SIS domain-containing protein [Acidimicrobiia bacterium]